MKTKEHGIPEYLNSEEEMIAHLNETLKDSDPASFLVALGDIANQPDFRDYKDTSR